MNISSEGTPGGGRGGEKREIYGVRFIKLQSLFWVDAINWTIGPRIRT